MGNLAVIRDLQNENRELKERLEASVAKVAALEAQMPPVVSPPIAELAKVGKGRKGKSS